jgi:hypothetical protein
MQETGSPRDGKTGPPAFIPPDALEKIPLKFGMGIPNNKTRGDKKEGWRWFSPAKPEEDGVRIDKGDPNSKQPSQRVDHVIIRSGGVVIGRDGKPINGSINENAEKAHIPLEEYRKWQRWDHP